MDRTSGDGKSFLFLQGPHGPFFYQLSKEIVATGARVCKVGFNQGDRFFWPDKETYLAFTDAAETWESYVTDLINKGVTDLVVYGDTRPLHKSAIAIAKSHGVTVHCFEEGYIRPYWVTYERGGVNGHSRLMDMTVDQMRDALSFVDTKQPEAPARWGEMRQHILLGAIYHWHILFRNWRYKNYKTHRDTSVRHEFWLHFKRLMTRPVNAYRRWKATQRIKNNGFVYHLSLLQLGHDASIRSHSSFTNMPDFMQLCVESFAAGAPRHHHLVFKSHPLEDGRQSLRKVTEDLARKYGVEGRVHFVRGGKLAALLDHARSVVTINSTAAQQALWRGLPVKAIGESVYRKLEFTSEQPLTDFFADPRKPDLAAYRDYRQYLLATSQLTGGFYARKSRVRLIRRVVDMLLNKDDPYEMLAAQKAAPVQQLRVVK
jgi:capsular polysaccharide export protein